MAQICGEMAELFDKRLKNVENDGKWPKYLGNVLDTDTALVFEKRLNYVGNEKRLNYVGNDLSVGNGSNMWGKDLII